MPILRSEPNGHDVRNGLRHNLAQWKKVWANSFICCNTWAIKIFNRNAEKQIQCGNTRSLRIRCSLQNVTSKWIIVCPSNSSSHFITVYYISWSITSNGPLLDDFNFMSFWNEFLRNKLNLIMIRKIYASCVQKLFILWGEKTKPTPYLFTQKLLGVEDILRMANTLQMLSVLIIISYFELNIIYNSHIYFKILNTKLWAKYAVRYFTGKMQKTDSAASRNGIKSKVNERK